MSGGNDEEIESSIRLGWESKRRGWGRPTPPSLILRRASRLSGSATGRAAPPPQGGQPQGACLKSRTTPHFSLFYDLDLCLRHPSHWSRISSRAVFNGFMRQAPRACPPPPSFPTPIGNPSQGGAAHAVADSLRRKPSRRVERGQPSTVNRSWLPCQPRT